jgi:hypothetical protein
VVAQYAVCRRYQQVGLLLDRQQKEKAMTDTRTNTVEDALALVGNGYLVLPVEIAQSVCTLLGVSSDATGLPIVSWKDGDEAWNTYGLAGREGPGEGVESVMLSYYVVAQLGISPAPGSAFSEQRLSAGKQAEANMAAIREALLERGVQGPAVQAGRLIPTGWPTYPLKDEMRVSERSPAELDYLLSHGDIADRKIRSTSGAAILTYRVIWKGQVEGHPAFGKYAIAEHNTETRKRTTLAIRSEFEQLREEFAIDLSAWYWIRVEGREEQAPT